MDLDPLFPLLSKLKPSEQVVFIHLFQHKTNDDVYASQKHLMAWTGIKSINTIKSALKGLGDQGFLTCLKAGRQNAPALYRLCLPGVEKGKIIPEENTLQLSSENQLRFAAIKKGFSPASWQEIKREAKAVNMTEDRYIINKYFGPARLNG